MPKGTLAYYCCHCGSGPQLVTINPYCPRCYRKSCQKCSYAGLPNRGDDELTPRAPARHHNLRRVDTPAREPSPRPPPTSTRPPMVQSTSFATHLWLGSDPVRPSGRASPRRVDEVQVRTFEPDVLEAEEFKPAERIALMLSSHGELQPLMHRAFSYESDRVRGAFDTNAASFLSAYATELLGWSSNQYERAVCDFVNSNPFTIVSHIKEPIRPE